MDTKIIEEQLKICDKYSVKYTPTDMGLLLGISDNTDGKTVPINGLRHPSEGHSTGWYIWSGEQLPNDKNFFKPLHANHLVERCPQALQFLGLPVGYRFLIDPQKDYIDVWYDESLLNLEK